MCRGPSLVAYAALYLIGLLTNDLPPPWLGGLPGYGWQVWRFVTAPLIYRGVSSTCIARLLRPLAVFFWFTAPQLERMLGLRPFLDVLACRLRLGHRGHAAVGRASFGLTAPLFGLFAALLVGSGSDPRMRTQILIIDRA